MRAKIHQKTVTMELKIQERMNVVRRETVEALQNLRQDALEVQKSQGKMRKVLNRMDLEIPENAAGQARSDDEEEEAAFRMIQGI